MFISGKDHPRWRMAKTGFVYLLMTIICALFGAIYERFSHDVFSYYMIYAFAFPLVGGVLPFFSLAYSSLRLPGRFSLNLYHSGIAAMTVGSMFQGALEIYGTTNGFVCVYWAVGTALLLCGVGTWGIGRGS